MKLELRKEMRQWLKEMSDEELAAGSSALVSGVMAKLPAWRTARRVMLYVPMRSEPNIRPLVETLWSEGREVVLPWFPETAAETGAAGTSGAAEISAHSVSPPLMSGRLVCKWSQVHPGLSGFSQPNEALCPVVPPDSLDLILVPGIAFDSKGGRLGRGRGDYDRFLPATRKDVVLCGVCFHVTYLNGDGKGNAEGDEKGNSMRYLPLEAHDVPMDAVATDIGVFPTVISTLSACRI
jgi:5-formyltetrahydrofolate cyclo-ligase